MKILIARLPDGSFRASAGHYYADGASLEASIGALVLRYPKGFGISTVSWDLSTEITKYHVMFNGLQKEIVQ